LPEIRAVATRAGCSEAELSGLKIRRAYERASDGRLPAAMIGGRWHVRAEDRPAVAAALGVPPHGVAAVAAQLAIAA
jgi:hypothetical protein